MSPTALFYLLLVALLCSVAAFLAAAFLPDERLALLASLPAKRILGCLFAVNFAAVSVVVYTHMVLPSPPRFAYTMALMVIVLLGPAVVVSGVRPEELSFTVNPEAGLADFKVKFGGLNGWSVLLGFGLLFFLWAVIFYYPAQYYRYDDGAGAPQ
jgi:hypothetical protein